MRLTILEHGEVYMSMFVLVQSGSLQQLPKLSCLLPIFRNINSPFCRVIIPEQ
jgi:hypothetical protein